MIVPLILSGGSGTRLWPLSRKLYPKQFISLINETSLFQDTINRLPNNVESPIVICNEEHRFIVSEQLRQINSKNNGIILEPIGKNTAPAIALAAFNLIKKGLDPVLLVLSSDHLIQDIKKFHESVEIASSLAKKGKLVALGVKPTKPETGYGYIEIDNSNNNQFYNISSFVEKPNLKNAEAFLKSGNFYWNSGIFLFKASIFLNELEKFESNIFKICKESLTKTSTDIDFIRPDKKKFHRCQDKSSDYAVMEKTDQGVVVPFNGGWSDIGSWESLWDSKPKDKNDNVTEGDTLLSNVKSSFIHSSNRLVTVHDVSNLVIVDTQDALLVSNIKNSQNIKKIFTEFKINDRVESVEHRKVYRPWGYYDSIDSGLGFQVKRIFVNPGAKLSLQKHEKRAEHWVVVKGVALITCGKKVFYLNENQSTYVPKGEVHRLENTEKTPLEIIEIQTGDYLGEDDIIRLEDQYKRK